MPTTLETLQSELTSLIDKIIIEAKKEALQNGNAGTSGNSGTTSTVVFNSKIDLKSHILSNFESLTKDNKEKNIMTPYVNPFNWPRNNNCWAKSLDLTGYCSCVLGLGGVGGGTLITRKHVLLANHVPYANTPFLIFFVNNDNTTFVYNVIKTKRVANTDILIGELDREVDSQLKIYKILSNSYSKYINGTFPVLYSDQERKALVGEFLSVYNQNDGTNFSVGGYTNGMSKYFEMLVGGDSGNPIFTIINNEPVLIGAWYRIFTFNTGLGTFLPAQINEINNTISSLSSGGYKVNEIDLTNFKLI